MLKIQNKYILHIRKKILIGKVYLISIFNKEVNQRDNYTCSNRYPEIFSTIQKAFLNRSSRILSYGCSTGEECFSLRNYFPKSEIHGVDINKDNLNTAQKNNSDKNIFFSFSRQDKLIEGEKFDIILCMSVLCVWPNTKGKKNINNIYSFSKFEKTIEFLDKILKKDGLLVIYNSNYKFLDSEIAKKYKIITDNNIPAGFVEQFDIKGDTCLNDENYIFKKIK